MTSLSTLHAAESRPNDALVAWAILLTGIGISSVFALTDTLSLKIASLGLLWMFAGASCRFDIVHPYMWWGAFYVLYGIAGPLLADIGIHPLGFWGGRHVTQLDFGRVIEYEYLAFVIILLVIGPRRMDLSHAKNDVRAQRFLPGILPVLVASTLILGALLGEIYIQGFATKGDVWLHGSFLTRLGFSYNLVVMAAAAYLFSLFYRGHTKAAWLFLAFFIVIATASVFISGQRNFIMRFAISAFFIVHIVHRRVNPVIIVVALIVGLLSVAWLGGQKMAFVTGSLETADDGNGDLFAALDLAEKYAFLDAASPLERFLKLSLVALFGTELMTSSNNLAIIIDRVPNELPYLNGQTMFVSDIVRGVLPGFLVGQQIDTSMAIYQRVFFPEYLAQGAGPGFTLLGVGYMNFGVPGIIMIALIFALAIRWIYRRAAASAFSFMFFVGAVPILVYSIRMDLAAPISQSIKHVWLPLVVMAGISFLIRPAHHAVRKLRDRNDRRRGPGFHGTGPRERRAAPAGGSKPNTP